MKASKFCANICQSKDLQSLKKVKNNCIKYWTIKVFLNFTKKKKSNYFFNDLEEAEDDHQTGSDDSEEDLEELPNGENGANGSAANDAANNLR